MSEVETAKMSERGQIIIPKDIRKYIGAIEDTIFTIMPLDKETIVMKKLDKMKLLREFNNIRSNVKGKLAQKEISEEILEFRKQKHN